MEQDISPGAVSELFLRSPSEKDIIAMERLQAHEPLDGYWLAFSGGKDSMVIYDLVERARVKFEAHYNVTGIDPPELVQFIRQQYPGVTHDKPPESFWKKLVEGNKGMPRRQARWCCEFLKERGGAGRTVVTGVRWAESTRRKARRLYEVCYRDETKHYLNPILDWSTAEVWSYIRGRGLPYCRLYDEGWSRIGCVLCPMASISQHQRDMARWPKLADAWKRASYRYWAQSQAAQKMAATPEHFWRWWLAGKPSKDPSQAVLFE